MFRDQYMCLTCSLLSGVVEVRTQDRGHDGYAGVGLGAACVAHTEHLERWEANWVFAGHFGCFFLFLVLSFVGAVLWRRQWHRGLWLAGAEVSRSTTTTSAAMLGGAEIFQVTCRPSSRFKFGGKVFGGARRRGTCLIGESSMRLYWEVIGCELEM